MKHYAASTEWPGSGYRNVGSVSEQPMGMESSTVGLVEKERIKLRPENGKILKQ